MRNRHHPEIIVVDPRKTETAMAATQHYGIAPKSDLVLLYGLANILIASGWIDRNYIATHTTGFAEFADFVTRFTPEMVSAATGISEERLWKFAETIANGKRVSFWWTMGVNQGHESTRTAQAIVNLALMTGNIGRPGTGANSITGQCNAMGSRLFSNITGLIGGHDISDAADREKVAAALKIDPAAIPTEPSKAYDRILEDIRSGKIKALWVIATNGAHSWIHQREFSDTLGKLDFLVVQDLYSTTETAQRAHLILPAAGWGEKEGTLINSERRYGLVKRVSRAPGQALSDFNIFKLIAHYWGCGSMFREWTSPEAAWQILKRVSKGQPCDITGIADYRTIDECGGVQWPWPAPDGSGEPGIPAKERRLFEDGLFFHPDGMARFIYEAPAAMPEPPCADYPFLLLTGRGTSAQWHTQTRTGKSDVLRKLYPEKIYFEINPADAGRLGIAPESTARIWSRRAQLYATAFVTETVQQGQIFIPMHYPEVNRLTFAAFDPYSRQPSYKACAVAVGPLPL
jgi:assimilatory nitrate reductase catalytic subunit